MITVKDFAAQQGCGESIVYRHIRNHKNELGDRVQKQHGKTWLTDEGAEYIRSLMNQPQVTFVESEASREEIRRLELTCAEMAGEVKTLNRLLKEKDEKLSQLSAPEQQISALKAQIDDLSADNEKKGEDLEKLETKLKNASDELTEALNRERDKDKKIEEYESELQAYAGLPAWKRLFVKPPMKKNKEQV